jgi:hypothetical protein
MTRANLTVQEQALWARDMSVAYLIAADQVDWRNAKTEPKFFLFCHSIELALKSYLLVNGHSEDECRDLGHDIAQALNLALVNGLSISDAEREIIVQLSYEHHKRFSFRYLQASNWSAPSPKNVSRCCRALITAIQRAVYAANEAVPSDENLALTR